VHLGIVVFGRALLCPVVETMPRILDLIDSPDHVKRLSIPELVLLAAEIREELITVLSNMAGSRPNLGVLSYPPPATSSRTPRRRLPVRRQPQA